MAWLFILLTLALQAILFSSCSVIQEKQDLEPILQQFAVDANSVAENTKTKALFLSNELMKNTSEIVDKAQGNVSQLVTNIYNDIQKGIETAQSKVATVISNFQGNFTEKVTEIRSMAEAVYSSTAISLRNTTSTIEDKVSNLIKKSEESVKLALRSAMDKIKMLTMGHRGQPSNATDTSKSDTVSTNTTEV